MLDTFKTLIVNQFHAALCTLNLCIDRCPEPSWHAPVGNYVFSQVAFHTLFYADFYLARDEASFRRQPFHLGNGHLFANYEELEDHAPRNLSERAPVRLYVAHCRRKVAEVLDSETDETLSGPSGFDWCKISRGELHAYNIRHIQHHAAQLSLRLRLDHGVDVPWIGSGWRDVAATPA